MSASGCQDPLSFLRAFLHGARQKSGPPKWRPMLGRVEFQNQLFHVVHKTSFEFLISASFTLSNRRRLCHHAICASTACTNSISGMVYTKKSSENPFSYSNTKCRDTVTTFACPYSARCTTSLGIVKKEYMPCVDS